MHSGYSIYNIYRMFAEMAMGFGPDSASLR